MGVESVGMSSNQRMDSVLGSDCGRVESVGGCERAFE